MRERRCLRARLLSLSSLASALVLAGCSGAEGSAEQLEPRPIPCEVQLVLDSSCLRCHGDKLLYGAPFAFTSLEQIHAVRGGKPVFERMHEALETNLMPPVGLPVDPPVDPISHAQRETLLRWTAQGAPEGPRCE